MKAENEQGGGNVQRFQKPSPREEGKERGHCDYLPDT